MAKKKPFKLENNFEKYKKDFTKDTKLKVEDNMAMYIQYYNARVMDEYAQKSLRILDDISSQIDYFGYS